MPHYVPPTSCRYFMERTVNIPGAVMESITNSQGRIHITQHFPGVPVWGVMSPYPPSLLLIAPHGSILSLSTYGKVKFTMVRLKLSFCYTGSVELECCKFVVLNCLPYSGCATVFGKFKKTSIKTYKTFL